MQHDETLGEPTGVSDIRIPRKQLVQTRLLIRPAPRGRTCKPLALLPRVACVEGVLFRFSMISLYLYRVFLMVLLFLPHLPHS